MKKIIVGNWKMNTTVPEGSVLLHKIHTELKDNNSSQIIVCPPATSLFALHRESEKLANPKIELGAQNISAHSAGAYTGEISAEMVKGLVKYTLVGHSERRANFAETDDDIAKKIQVALNHNLRVILCIGETHQQRANNKARQVILDQLNTDLSNASAKDMAKIIIAYEPVWAIGTGNFAKPALVEEIILLIRNALSQRYGRINTTEVPILYGGSVNSENAKAYLQLQGVNGLLVGGASLRYKEFASIIRSAN